MMHRSSFLLILSISLLGLSACTLPWSDKKDANTSESPAVASADCPVKPTDMGQIQGSGTGTVASTGSSVTLKYYLVDTCGKSVDASTKEKMGEFTFIIGSGQVVPGFERAAFGMKAGEKRDFTLAPVDAYGELDARSPLGPVSREQIEGVYTRVVDKFIYQDQGRLRQDIDDQELLAGLTVGKQVTSTQDPSVIATVESISGSIVTFVYDNSKSPFYKKPLVVGTKGEKDGVKYEIMAVTDTELTLREEVPSYRTLESQDITIGKKFALKAGTPLANNLVRAGLKPGDEVEIIEIQGDGVMILAPNRHPQAGKSLVFHIEVQSVK